VSRARRLRVALIGATGQLGRDLAEALAEHELLALGHDRVEVGDRRSVAAALAGFPADWVVSTAAFHDVDGCEGDVERALRVNALGAWNGAVEAAAVGARFLYVSTDYVFEGGKGRAYVESDAPAPPNAYGASKLAGELLALSANPETLIVRTAALYGRHPCRGKGGSNFVERMLARGRERGRVRVVDDETVSPTYTVHLARAVAELIARDARRVVHVAGSGHCTWWELAQATFEEAGLEVEVERARPGEFPHKARRPAFSALASDRLEGLGVAPLAHWREGLRAYLAHVAARPTA
jgi:dTDP-4-dehydrorhamnose reductase